MTANPAPKRGAKSNGKPCIKCGGTLRYLNRCVCVACTKRRNLTLVERAQVYLVADEIKGLPEKGRKLLFETLGVTP